MTITDDERLVGGTATDTNQPTNRPDMSNDMLVILTPDSKVAIGDPSPVGEVIGQFIPVDGDYGVIEWAEQWNPVELQEHCQQLHKALEDSLAHAEELHKCIDRANQHTAHAMTAVRWHVRNMADLLLNVYDENAASAPLDEAYALLAGQPCVACELTPYPDGSETVVEFFQWLADRAVIRKRTDDLFAKVRADIAAAEAQPEGDANDA